MMHVSFVVLFDELIKHENEMISSILSMAMIQNYSDCVFIEFFRDI